MARRTNLISAILGGVGGGIEAGLEQRERTLSAREREAERKRAAEAAQLQREQFDALQAQRGREAEAAAAERALRFANEGITAIDPLANASRRAMDAAPAPTMPRPAGMSMTQGRAPQGVAPLFTLGGKEYAKTGPSAVERALQTTRAEEERKIQTLMATGMTRQDAAAQVIAGRAPTAKILPPWQREGFGSEAEYLRFLRGEAVAKRPPVPPGGGGPGTPRGGGTPSKTSLQSTLPNVIENAERLLAMTPEDMKKLSARRMDVTAMAEQAGPVTGGGLRLLQSIVPYQQPSDDELQYMAMANATADAVARATDIGVLSNFDVERFRNQVAPRANDTEQRKIEKLRVLQGWAAWLVQNRKALEDADAAYEAGRPDPNIQLRAPGESDEEFAERVGRTPPPQAGRVGSPTTPAPRMTADEWMDANPQRAGETDAAYLQRARAGVAAGGR